MTRVFIAILTAWLCAFAAFANGQGDTVFLEIADGDTAFLVDKKARAAWWIVGECRRPIPMPKKGQKSRSQNNQSMMISEVQSDSVQMGSRQVDLRQQFRFTLDATSPSVEVYNSLRGGWASVPVREVTNCVDDAACRARMVLPEC